MSQRFAVIRAFCLLRSKSRLRDKRKVLFLLDKRPNDAGSDRPLERKLMEEVWRKELP